MTAKTQNPNVTVKRDEENPEPIEIIADAIIKISEGIQKLNASPLSRRGILLLIQDNCKPVGSTYNKKKPSITVIETVINSITSLKRVYTKDIPPKKSKVPAGSRQDF